MLVPSGRGRREGGSCASAWAEGGLVGLVSSVRAVAEAHRELRRVSAALGFGVTGVSHRLSDSVLQVCRTGGAAR